MKVLILSSCVNGGGAGRSLENYIRHLDPMIEAHVVIPERGVVAETLEKKSKLWIIPEFVERIHKSPYRLPKFLDRRGIHLLLNCWALPKAMRKIVKIAKTLRPQVIYCNHMLANPLGAFVGWRLKIPVVFHARNIHVAPFGRFFYSFLAKLECVKTVICNSHASAELFKAVVPQKVRIIYNFLDLEKFDPSKIEGTLRKTYGLPKEAVVAGYIGRILPKKGIQVLIHAFKEAYAKDPHLHLVILGGNDGGLREDLLAKYRRLGAQLGVADRLIFTGFQKDIRPWLKDFDFVVLPSIEPESFGRILIEGMAFGIPSIATSIGGAVEVVKHGENGLLVQPKNTRQLADALCALSSQSDYRKILGARGQAMVHSRFASRGLAHQISDVFFEIETSDPYRAVAS